MDFQLVAWPCGQFVLLYFPFVVGGPDGINSGCFDCDGREISSLNCSASASELGCTFLALSFSSGWLTAVTADLNAYRHDWVVPSLTHTKLPQCDKETAAPSLVVDDCEAVATEPNHSSNQKSVWEVVVKCGMSLYIFRSDPLITTWSVHDDTEPSDDDAPSSPQHWRSKLYYF